jgi:hypothetical protein
MTQNEFASLKSAAESLVGLDFKLSIKADLLMELITAYEEREYFQDELHFEQTKVFDLLQEIDDIKQENVTNKLP